MPHTLRTFLCRAGLCPLLLALAIAGAAEAAAVEIVWSVVHRFRTIADEQAADAFPMLVQKHLKAVRGARLAYPEPGLAATATHWEEYRAQYDRAWVHDPARVIEASIRGIELKKDDLCVWSLDGTEAAKAPGCAPARFEAMLGFHELVVEIRRNGEAHDRFEAPEGIEIADFRILALGDSFLAGEGNPHRLARHWSEERGSERREAPARWWDQRCHRSLLSSAAIAAGRYAAAHPHGSVTFLSYACSGAEISPGLLDPFEGRETVWQVRTAFARSKVQDSEPPILGVPLLPPQLDQAVEALCPLEQWDPSARSCRTPPAPDAIVLQVGGNDIGFGEIVRQFGLNTLRSEAEFDQFGRQIRERLAEKFAPQQRILSEQIERRLAPKRVLVLEYPDPTGKGKGTYCADRQCFDQSGSALSCVAPALVRRTFLPRMATFFGLGVSEQSSRFAREQVLKPLNDRLRSWVEAQQAAGRGWAFVGGIADYSAEQGKGYCTDDRWFVVYPEAETKQGLIPIDKNSAHAADADGDGKPDPVGGIPSGAMHPNIFAHSFIADLITRRLEP